MIHKLLSNTRNKMLSMINEYKLSIVHLVYIMFTLCSSTKFNLDNLLTLKFNYTLYKFVSLVFKLHSVNDGVR